MFSRCLVGAAGNQGVAEARNAGFLHSSGDYIIFLDADDRLIPTAAEAHLHCLADHPEAGFAVGDIDLISRDGSYLRSPRWPNLAVNQYEQLLKVDHVANTIAVMFRRSVFESIGGFDGWYRRQKITKSFFALHERFQVRNIARSSRSTADTTPTDLARGP